MESDICPICNNPKVSKTSGSLTQWISTCTCDIADSIENEVPIVLCKDCGKRVNQGRSGSLTQYIFRSDVCQCQKPNIPDELKTFEPLYSTTQTIVEEESFEELAHEINGFPYERYTPVKELGAGVSSAVYLSEDKLLNKKVAVKMLHLTASKQLVAFHEEAKATSQLEHPSIVKLLDFGVSESEIPYMVLEYLRGESLEAKLIKEGKLTWIQCQRVFSDVLSGLQYAHENKIFHRDIKPSNIIVLDSIEQSSVKIIDFGIAKVEEKGASPDKENIVGAPLYMSPDQGLGRVYDARSELYSVGCVLYECLTGRPPFKGDTALETLSKHVREEALPLSEFLDNIPDELEQVVSKALKKEPDLRYQSAHDFRQALLNIVVEENVEEEILSVENDTGSSRRAPLISAFVGIILLLFIAGVGALIHGQANKPESELVSDDQNSFKVLPVMPEMDETYKQLNLDQKGWSLSRPFTYIGRSVTDDDFRELEGKKVMGVKVLHSQVTGEGLKYIAPEELNFLSITSQIFDEKGASLIPRFKMLRTIRIHASDKLTNKTIEYLLSSPELRSLEIRYTDKFPSKALSIISKSKRLVKLDIGKCSPISHDEFSKIADIKNLRIFRMPLTDIDDTYIDTVLKTKIEFLEVADSKVSDRGLLKLAELKSLKEVTVNLYNSPITAVGLQRFHRLNPDVSIVVNDGPAIDSTYTKRGQSELEDLSERAQSSLRKNRKR